MTKRCPSCGETKPREGFYRNSTAKDGLGSECKACARERYRRWKATNRDQRLATGARWRAQNPDKIKAQNALGRLRRYGLTPELYEARLASQGGACAACRTGEPGGKGAWHIDHDHACCAGRTACGKCIRGLLCHGCNLALGNVDDSKERLLALVEYLDRHA